MSLTKQILDLGAYHFMPGHMDGGDKDWTNWEREEIEDFDYPHGGTTKPAELDLTMPEVPKNKFSKIDKENMEVLTMPWDEKNRLNDEYLKRCGTV